MPQADDDLSLALHGTLLLLKTNRELSKGGRRLRREMIGLPDWIFEKTCEKLERAHEFGLTRIREIVRDGNGKVIEIVFEQVLTPAGAALVDNPPPRVELSADTRQFLRERLQRQLETGESGGSPMINGLGEPAGDLSDYLDPEQIRANAKQQLELLDEMERKATRK
jgi:hypothetical protein